MLKNEMHEKLLLNLLAVIHRDGGHYVAEHGLEKAYVDAAAKVAPLVQAQPVAEVRDLNERAKYINFIGNAADYLESGTLLYALPNP